MNSRFAALCLQHFTLEIVACRRAKPTLQLFRAMDFHENPCRAINSFHSFIALVLCALCLTACAGRRAGLPADPAELRAARQQYADYASEAAGERRKPTRLQTSLRFGTENDSRRVVALLWENGSGPIRLDVRAGIGASAAKILQDDRRFLLYAVQEGRAYYHDGPRQSLINYGLPLPFGLRDLAALLAGDFGAVFGPALPDTAERTPSGNLLFTLSGKPGGLVEIGPRGLPLVWRDEKDGWTLTFGYDDAARPLPRRVEARHKNGKYALLLVKERERPAVPFTREQLDLPLPPGTPLSPMKEMKRL